MGVCMIVHARALVSVRTHELRMDNACIHGLMVNTSVSMLSNVACVCMYI